MNHQAGVRTVVAGGRPDLGAMQAVGGSRGAQSYTSVDIDDDIEIAEILNTTVNGSLPDRSVGNYINFAEFNIKDAIREGENFPLQFAYEPATCRIFYTQHTVYNFLNLWNYVVDAVWRNPSLCIDGSANGTTILPTNTTGPAQNSDEGTATADNSIASLILTGLSSGPVVAIPSSQPQKREYPTPTSPDEAPSSIQLPDEIDDNTVSASDCSACSKTRGYICAKVPTCVNGKTVNEQRCERACQKGGSTCQKGSETCYFNTGPGFCFSNRESRQLSSCKTPTSNPRSQATKAVGDGNFRLPYGRSGRGPRG